MSRRAELLVATLAALAVAALIALAAVTAVPPVLRNLSTEVSDGITGYTIDDDHDVRIIVPEGWIVQRLPGDALRVLTPDGVLTVEVTAAAGAPRDVLADLFDERATTPTGPVRTEELPGGLRVAHADVDDQVYAAVTAGGAASVGFVAESTGEPRAYRPALAELLMGVRS